MYFMYLRFFFLFLFWGNTHIIFSQISYPGRPNGLPEEYKIPFIQINPPAEISNHNVISKYKKKIFADVVRVKITPERNGNWLKKSDSSYIWYLGLCSGGTASIGLSFYQFRLNPGVKLFIYPYNNIEKYYGAFTFRNNKSDRIFPVSPLENDSIVIEMQVYGSPYSYGSLEIGQVAIGKDRKKNEGDFKILNYSADCNVDVTCYTHQALQINKHAVCKIIYNNSGICTGTLLNNTSYDLRPLILTASHCIENEIAAETSIFYFDYEKEICGGNVKPFKSIAGSKLLARNEELDFALLELDEKIPLDFNPVFAGWDVRGEAFKKSYTIHHPQGDVKKVSVNEDLLLEGRLFNLPNDDYWVLPDYEIGTTEAGSSGSAIFDSAFHIKGILSYGGASCTPYIYDYYIRLDKAWAPSPDSTQQLAYWLNPLKNNEKILPSYIPNPYIPFAQLISNIKGNELVVSETFFNEGYIAGTNPTNVKEFAEHFKINGAKYIHAVQIFTHKVFSYSNQSKVILKIWSGLSKPEKILYQQTLLLFELASEYKNLIRLDSVRLVEKSFFISIELKDIHPADTFALYYSRKESFAENTALIKYNRQWTPLFDGSMHFPASYSIDVFVFDYPFNYKTQPGIFPYSDWINVYPNPASDKVHILFKKAPTQRVFYKIYDLQGRLIISLVDENFAANTTLNLGKLKSGIYVIFVESEWGVFNKKLLIK